MMTENEPLVSICIPTYNRAELLGRAVRSALSQSYARIEVLVIDNASSDNTPDVIAAFSDPRLFYSRNEKNLGLFGNFNRCLELAKGDLIHILHSDDSIDPRFTETCVIFFLEHPDVGLTFTAAKIVKGTQVIGEIIPEHATSIFRAPEGFRRILMERSFIVCPSVMARREIYNEVGMFSQEYPYSADYMQWLKIARIHNIAFIREAILYYHQGEHSESYRLLFGSASGYLDTLKIYHALTDVLGTDRFTFATELNIALKRFIYDVIYAGFTRSRTVRFYNSSVFIGIAMSTAGLMVSDTVISRIRRWILIAVIMGSGLVMAIPGIREVVGTLLTRKRHEIY